MPWEVEFTDEFNQWWHTLTMPEQRALGSRIGRLRVYGVGLSRKYSKRVRVRNGLKMHELRAQSEGRPLCVLYAFDPRMTAIVLLGGDKTGDSDFYPRNIPLAYDLYDAHIRRLKREGLI